jgi:hypothetical protein
VEAGAGNADAIAAVAARMEAIAAPLAPDDGVRRFNELYLTVTLAVAREVASGGYEHPEFMARLDVVFADLYFAAVDAAEAGRKVPRAWAPLFEKRAARGIAPLQFAIAGMNAHINHDLALALVATTREFDVGLKRGTPQHRDYVAVDTILERVQEQIKERFASGVVADLDRAAGRVDDLLASWSVAHARDNAWTQAQTLSRLGASGLLREQFLRALARDVGVVGRALLVRTA